jgi:hypothetical protein
MKDLQVIFEHPEWQKPLFAALEKRGVDFSVFDLKSATFGDLDPAPAKLVFSQASPSAYVRGNVRAVPMAMAYMQWLETSGVRVLNGTRAFRLELSKSTQAALMRKLGIGTPRTVAFNSVDALKKRQHEITFPCLLKPEQGGSGARIHVAQNFDELMQLVEANPHLWEPDQLLLAQEYLPHDPERGIVRMEFLGETLLYAMRVISHGRFNLCPSPVCNPASGEGHCEIPAQTNLKPVEFYPYAEVPREAVEQGRALFLAAGLDVGGIEYMDTTDGRRMFYDVNANSNMRPAIGKHFGFDPFERVVDFLQAQLTKRA